MLRRGVWQLRGALAAHGLPIAGGSRSSQFIDLAERFARREITASSDHEILGAAPRGYRDLLDLQAAADAFLPTSDPSVIDRFRFVLSGDVLPTSGRPSPARDFQFELALGGWLAASGLRTRLAEPDVVSNYAAQR